MDSSIWKKRLFLRQRDKPDFVVAFSAGILFANLELRRDVPRKLCFGYLGSLWTQPQARKLTRACRLCGEATESGRRRGCSFSSALQERVGQRGRWRRHAQLVHSILSPSLKLPLAPKTLLSGATEPAQALVVLHSRLLPGGCMFQRCGAA